MVGPGESLFYLPQRQVIALGMEELKSNGIWEKV